MRIPTTALSALPLASLFNALPIAYPSEYTSPTLFIPPSRSHFDHSPPPTQSTVVHYTIRGDLPDSPCSLTTTINAQPAYKGNITVEKGVAMLSMPVSSSTRPATRPVSLLGVSWVRCTSASMDVQCPSIILSRRSSRRRTYS